MDLWTSLAELMVSRLNGGLCLKKEDEEEEEKDDDDEEEEVVGGPSRQFIRQRCFPHKPDDLSSISEPM